MKKFLWCIITPLLVCCIFTPTFGSPYSDFNNYLKNEPQTIFSIGDDYVMLYEDGVYISIGDNPIDLSDEQLKVLYRIFLEIFDESIVYGRDKNGKLVKQLNGSAL